MIDFDSTSVDVVSVESELDGYLACSLEINQCESLFIQSMFFLST